MGSNSTEENFFQNQEFRDVLETIGWETASFESRKRGCHASETLAYASPTVPVLDRVLRSYKVFYGPCMRPFGEDASLEVLDCLLKGLCATVKQQGAFFLEVRTPFPFPFGSEVFVKNRFVRTEFNGQYSVIIDLEKDLETLWKEMKRFARRSVKKAVESGVQIEGVETETHLHQFYEIYLQTSNRRCFDPLPYSLFENLWAQLEPKGLVKFFIASWKKRPIAAILNTFYHGQSVPYIACSLNRYWKLHPNHLLFWHSIEWSKEVAGSSTFNLYHLPSKRDQKELIDYYTFKTCFGGRLIEECASYHRIISPTKFKVFQVMNEKLPKWCRPRVFSDCLHRTNRSYDEA